MVVSLDREHIESVGSYLSTLDSCAAFNWTGAGFPSEGDSNTINFFFLTVKHQFGFWLDDGEKYLEPMYAKVDGKNYKGSDFIWNAVTSKLNQDPTIYNIERQAEMSDDEIESFFSDDDGNCPLPLKEEHIKLFREFAQDMLSRNETPESVVAASLNFDDPVKTLLGFLSNYGGYKEDPLEKKAALLAIILANRPEHFIKSADNQVALSFPPVVDYHIQRSAVRIGLVNIDDEDLARLLEERKILSVSQEDAIRKAVYEAMVELVRISGKGMDELDWFFFQNRLKCPEMSEPVCSECEIESKCAQKKQLFQPVIRTTAY